MKDKCPKCNGEGVIDSVAGKPWSEADRIKVRSGELQPETCPECKRTGKVEKAEPAKQEVSN